MTALATTHHEALMLSGPAFARGRAQSGTGGVDLAERVRKATVGRVEAARDAGWLTPEQRDYIVAQRRFAETEDPDGLSELAGIAEGFGLDEEELFLHLHLGTLRDLAEGASLADDGCSAWAAGAGPDGPLVVKNRDFGGTHLGIQRLMWHQGPDIVTGGMMCLGSLGSPGAYSSGMNAAGLALADTQIGSRTHAVGWLRYFLMTRLLATCPTVEAALDRICATRHAGGGSLVMADATGATAAVELGADQVVVTRGALSWRTNHFLSAELAAQTLTRGGGRIAANSAERLDCLSATLPRQSWNVAGAAALMARHANDPAGAPICQHPGPEDDTLTISSVIYEIDQRRVYLHEGNPCAGRWKLIRLPA
jgi:isopenicillin-N N-acyltransferase like protein